VVPGCVAVTTEFLFVSLLLSLMCKGDPYPAKCAQRTLGAGDFFCCGLYGGAAAGFSFVKSPHTPSGWRT
jgi:hypothetical protein